MDKFFFNAAIMWAICFAVTFVGVKRMPEADLRKVCPTITKYFREKPLLMFAVAPGIIFGCGWDYK